jgi:Ni,Fe-hydrogenase III large subunit
MSDRANGSISEEHELSFVVVDNVQNIFEILLADRIPDKAQFIRVVVGNLARPPLLST